MKINAQVDWPTYKCHKIVQAARIKAVRNNSDGALLMLLNGDDVRVDSEFRDKHRPFGGGYLVRYADGYLSFSPAAAFEGGYTQVEQELPASMATGMKAQGPRNLSIRPIGLEIDPAPVIGDPWERRETKLKCLDLATRLYKATTAEYAIEKAAELLAWVDKP
jgi:hypothetical protein